MSTNAARAWPHFVPRSDLDLELRHVNDRFEDFQKRLEKFDLQHDEFSTHLTRSIDEFRIECRKRMQQSVDEMESSLLDSQTAMTSDLEDMRSFAAPSSEVKPALASAQVGLNSLAQKLADTNDELRCLKASHERMSDFNKATYVSKMELDEILKRYDAAYSSSFSDVRKELKRLDDDIRVDINDLVRESKQTKDDLELSGAVTSSCLDCLKKDVECLQNHCSEEDAFRYKLTETSAKVTELERHMETAKEDRAALHEEIEHERDVLRRTLARWQESAQEVEDSVTKIHEFDGASKKIQAWTIGHAGYLKALDERERAHHDAILAAQRTHRHEHDAFLKTEWASFRKDFDEHVAWSRLVMDQLRQHKTDLSFEQMDKAIGLQHSVEKIELGHQEMHRTLRSIQLPSLA